MGIFEELGVARVINAKGTYTVYGGSIMSRQTIADISEISSSFVDLKELQRKIHEKLAQMTHNEAAYVCNGAGCGMYLSLAASIAKKLKKPFRYVTPEEISQSEVIVFRSHLRQFYLSNQN